MNASLPACLRLGALLAAPLACLVPRADAQVVIMPELIASYAAWPVAREAAPDDPAQEPVVSLASLVIALADGVDAGAVKIAPGTALVLELHLGQLIDAPVLSRAEAGRYAAEIARTLEPRQLVTLVGLGHKRNYAGNPGLLGATAATANPFYDPSSLPGFGARFVLAHLNATLRPADRGPAGIMR